MLDIRNVFLVGVIGLVMVLTSCNVPKMTQRVVNKETPAQFPGVRDSVNAANINWRAFFADPYLAALIDTALENNQELNIVLQEIKVMASEARTRKGEYLPFVDIGGGAGAEKVGRYTSQGANDSNTDIEPGRSFPEILPDFSLAAYASWEVDIWHKLRNARQASLHRLEATVEGRNFLMTVLISEIAESYYELLALDNQLEILRGNIEIQQNALVIVKQEKRSARVTELAVKKFEAELFKNQSSQFFIQQSITEAENRINFLVGRYPQPIQRNKGAFFDLMPDEVSAGIPAQLLLNRPDILQAEQELEAAKLDVLVARANFYPSLRLDAGIGLEAFNPAFLIRSPESLLASLAGEMAGPLINRNAIKAAYNSANAKQVQAVFNYEQSLLTAYIEVVNQLSKMDNLKKSLALQSKQVEALKQSINISTNLFRSAKADYMEVLLTQRDALEARTEMVDTKLGELKTLVRLYQALGGGWKE